MKQYAMVNALVWSAFLALGMSAATPLNAQPACGPGQTPASFAFTGAEQTSVVPAGVTSVTMYLLGAQGGGGGNVNGSIGGAGGLGGGVSGTLAVTPGATLSIWVGGQGSQVINAGGAGGGAAGIGGGATDVRVGGNAIGNRVAVAGGGGGGGMSGCFQDGAGGASNIFGGAGGIGGGGSGGNGANDTNIDGPFGGSGGATGTGGAAGAGCGGFPATAGSIAGDGGTATSFFSCAGAGGGGGGGGGAAVGPGGGGAGVGTTACQNNDNGGGGGGAGGTSSNISLTSATITNGVQAGNGLVLLCYDSAQVAITPTTMLRPWMLLALGTLLALLALVSAPGRQ
ncbi:MAG: hypothetical protein KGI64_06440 [Xanthomonadaceae bacterium]|nr:hypothetical protein [Xanthomonadaceae bacterium]